MCLSPPLMASHGLPTFLLGLLDPPPSSRFDKCVPAFAVPAGALGLSVTVFCVCALICFSVLILRRKWYGFELGGPAKPAQYTACLLVGLWLTYVVASIIIEQNQ